MKRTFIQAGLWAVAFLVSTSFCQADLAPFPSGRTRPRPRPETPAPPIAPQADKGVPIVVKVDSQATTAKLQIPQKLLPKTQLSQVEAPETSRTVIAGVALSGAMASVVLLRGRSRTVRAAAVCALLAAGMLGAVQIVSANAPPSRLLNGNQAPIALEDGPRVSLEIVKTGDRITLTLPQSMIPQPVGAAAPTSPTPQ